MRLSFSGKEPTLWSASGILQEQAKRKSSPIIASPEESALQKQNGVYLFRQALASCRRTRPGIRTGVSVRTWPPCKGAFRQGIQYRQLFSPVTGGLRHPAGGSPMGGEKRPSGLQHPHSPGLLAFSGHKGGKEHRPDSDPSHHLRKSTRRPQCGPAFRSSSVEIPADYDSHPFHK